MKAKIIVKFESINGTPVDNNLLLTVPQLFLSTEKTVQILCDNIEKYFKDNKIKTKATFVLEK